MSSSSVATPKISPMMQQWHQCKKQSKDAILLFRMGDFYEAFYDDAITLSQDLDLTLTKRQGIPMSGVPVHTCSTYVDRLVAKGHKVAVAEQMEDPKHVKGIVKREIVRFVTPGTVMDSSLLKDKANNFLVSVVQLGKIFGISFIDVSTGEFSSGEWDSLQEVFQEIYRLKPSELLISERFFGKHTASWEEIKKSWDLTLTVLDDWRFDHQMAHDFLVEHFKVHNLDGFGFKGKTASVNAAGSLGLYVTETLCLPFNHVQDLSVYTSSGTMLLDQSSQRNLELTESLDDRTKKGTLLDIMDHTHTPMGGRLLAQWIKKPLIESQKINQRLEATHAFYKNEPLLSGVRQSLSGVRDIERLMQKIHSGYASPRDLVMLKHSLVSARELKDLPYNELQSSLLKKLFEGIESLQGAIELVEHAVVEEPPLKVSEGGVFKDGVDADLDELRDIKANSKAWLIKYQDSLREEAGIKTLKVGYNRVFGYYIEVSRGQSHLMPETYVRRQTLANNERFISPELKEYEEKVLTAEEKISSIETRLFQELREKVLGEAKVILKTAKAIAMIDVLSTFADNAKTYQYVRPHVDESLDFIIKDGRHPVVEALSSEKFISNDTNLNGDDERLVLLTGPNMAGKSTFIRQVALIAIMAQMGSFVPASEVRIGVCDKVFTRIGASDNLARGQSTFMVEMNETANILNNATDRSLVILDEIGRGTSTYDGISIAWSVAEYLLTHEGSRARTLFATHYWELTQLEGAHPGAVNYNVAVRECSDQIIFLRKIIKGGTDKSYGIHVAKLAGLPAKVIQRAGELLAQLEEKGAQREEKGSMPTMKKRQSTLPKDVQLSLF